ncbi:MAG TPA: MauE/DoxX family redox-associated membrane protein [Candidatus Dormibacteraeota bacterium]|nr:MauE/DoxX family redox-associated membrane protein [Candidatus Dormibacteraeota bacterium]
MAWLVFALRVLLGGLLIVAGALKVSHPESLASAIAGYRLLPGALVVPLAIAIPPLELILGFYLAIGLFTRIASASVCAMLLVYAAAVASAVVRHIPANCGCFGPADAATADWPHVGVDAALAALAALIARRAPGSLALDATLSRAARKDR